MRGAISGWRTMEDLSVLAAAKTLGPEWPGEGGQAEGDSRELERA